MKIIMTNIKPKDFQNTKIFIENDQTAFEMDDSRLKLMERTAIACLQGENMTVGCEINILITDNDAIRRINSEFRNVDRPTDVLSFPAAEMKDGKIINSQGDFDPDEGLLLLGDIVISIETAVAHASEYGHSPERELAFLVSHGVFHLLGYDHMLKDEEAIMLAKQEAVLDALGLKRK